MAKVKTSYVCSQCGYETSKWNGKCPNCGEWNTFEEVELAVRAGGAKSKPTAVRDISAKQNCGTLYVTAAPKQRGREKSL